jgi:hypothetical protein
MSQPVESNVSYNMAHQELSAFATKLDVEGYPEINIYA